MSQAPISALRTFVRPRTPAERCDRCGAPLPAEHSHMFDPPSRRIHCACETCGILERSVYRLIPNRVAALPDFEINDYQWDNMSIPISLAFFSYSTPAGRTVALYPGPAGAAESLLPLDAWELIVETNPELLGLQSDVEALLVNRVGMARDYFIVPIDECYRLVGLIRIHWRGLSGGSLVWGEIASFFDQLRRKSEICQA